MTDKYTICAVSTAPGTGAIAVIRLSGEDAITICDKVFVAAAKHKTLEHALANSLHFGTLMDGELPVDEVVVGLFHAPHSYTGENVVEVSCHGAWYIQQKVMQLFLKNGARMARPGEFTLRAFMNGKMDLSQAEAVADVIASNSEASRRVAFNQMRGGFSHELKKLREKLVDFSSLIELELDFSEEDVEFANRKQLKKLIAEIENTINHLKDSFQLGNVIKQGVPVAIIGETNVGKSTLLNVLFNEERAIVSEIPGTTRDSIEDVLTLEGISFRFIDTAGIRKTGDLVENLGIEKTYQKIDQAGIILLLFDAQTALEEINAGIAKIKEKIDGKSKHLIVVFNKIDKLPAAELEARMKPENFPALDKNDALVAISARKKEHIDQLTSKIVETLHLGAVGKDDVIITNARHYEALNSAGEATQRVKEGLETHLSNDLIAMDIREILYSLGEITGEVTTDEVLGNIFSKFCIGK